MSELVIDSSAVLALLQGEPGEAESASLVSDGVISAVNASEVVAKLQDLSVPEDSIREALSLLSLRVAPFTAEHAYAAGLLRAQTKGLGLSLGDRACLALARSEGLDVLTADRAWTSLDVGVTVRLLR